MQSISEESILQQLLTGLIESVRICGEDIELCTQQTCSNAPGHLDDGKAADRLLAGILRMLDSAIDKSWPDVTDDDCLFPFLCSPAVSDEGSIDDSAETLAIAEMLCERDHVDTAHARASGPTEPFPTSADSGDEVLTDVTTADDEDTEDESADDDWLQFDSLCEALTRLSSTLLDSSVTLEQLECESEGLSDYMPVGLFRDPLEALFWMRRELVRIDRGIEELLRNLLNWYDMSGISVAVLREQPVENVEGS
ncbi:hypothetical protein LTR95_009897 [Oleoguttula sp. CCFEE 5521]